MKAKLKTWCALVPVILGMSMATVTGAESKLAGKDQHFIKEAAQGGMAEVKLGQLAREKAANPHVKSFGELMAADHSKANQELKSLAGQKGIELPADVGASHQSKADKLSKLSGAEFDKAYVDEMVKDHKEDVSKFESVSKNAKDDDLKAFAEKTLPTLRTHLQKIEALQKEIGK